MTEYTERLLSDSPRKEGTERVRVVWLIVIPLVAILSQVYVPRFIHFLAYLELPLLKSPWMMVLRRFPGTPRQLAYLESTGPGVRWDTP